MATSAATSSTATSAAASASASASSQTTDEMSEFLSKFPQFCACTAEQQQSTRIISLLATAQGNLLMGDVAGAQQKVARAAAALKTMGKK